MFRRSSTHSGTTSSRSGANCRSCASLTLRTGAWPRVRSRGDGARPALIGVPPEFARRGAAKHPHPVRSTKRHILYRARCPVIDEEGIELKHDQGSLGGVLGARERLVAWTDIAAVGEQDDWSAASSGPPAAAPLAGLADGCTLRGAVARVSAVTGQPEVRSHQRHEGGNDRDCQRDRPPVEAPGLNRGHPLGHRNTVRYGLRRSGSRPFSQAVTDSKRPRQSRWSRWISGGSSGTRRSGSPSAKLFSPQFEPSFLSTPRKRYDHGPPASSHSRRATVASEIALRKSSRHVAFHPFRMVNAAASCRAN